MTTGSPRIAILGAGRAGCSLFHSLSVTGQAPSLLWTRNEETARSARAEGLPATAGALPSLLYAELIFLAVSDPAVGPLAGEIAATRPLSTGAVVAHLAGALDLSPLDPLAAAGVAVGSLHPILSIATRETSLIGAPVSLAASSPHADFVLSAIGAQLQAKVIRPTGDRARYHAAAALAGNFPQVLLEAATRLLLDCGLSRDEAREAFGPLLVSAARNAAELGPAAGLTGPVVRGDVDVVKRHLGAMADSGEIAELYRAATRIAIELAEARGAPRLDELRALVSEDRK